MHNQFKQDSIEREGTPEGNVRVCLLHIRLYNLVIREKSHCTILPLDSRNKESAQIPCFWNPMVKWCNGIFL
jgi:hypothetical protein